MEIYSKKNFGFSLVELLVVIAVISTMMAILLPNLMGARERAQDSQKIQDLSAIKNGLRLYYNDHQAYPTPGAGYGPLDSDFNQYINNVGMTEYHYFLTDNGDGFVLCANLASGVGTDDTDSQERCGLRSPPNFPTSAPPDVCGLAVGTTGNAVFTVCAK